MLVLYGIVLRYLSNHIFKNFSLSLLDKIQILLSKQIHKYVSLKVK